VNSGEGIADISRDTTCPVGRLHGAYICANGDDVQDESDDGDSEEHVGRPENGGSRPWMDIALYDLIACQEVLGEGVRQGSDDEAREDGAGDSRCESEDADATFVNKISSL